MKLKLQPLKTFPGTPYLVLVIFLLFMLLIHRYIFLYADDLYYSRDAGYGLNNLPHFMLGELNANGRVWIGLLMLLILKYNIYAFRIFNPLVITLTVFLIAKISTYGYTNNRKDKNLRFLIAILCAGLFFLFLPVEITNTTIYYAACSFNYLYPTALAMLYVYFLLKTQISNNHSGKINYWILLLAFFVGSSTQQAGMIGIGFTVLFALYFKFVKEQKISNAFVSYFIMVVIGYCLVTYGSIKRMLYEDHVGNVVNLKDVVNGLLKTNIFSLPASTFVLLLSLSCIFWLYHYVFRNNQGLGTARISVGKILGVTLSLAVLGYIYVVLYRKFDVNLFTGGTANTILSLSLLAFTVVYLLSILYVSFLILQTENYPFLLFSSINAIGAQIMLLVANARFAEAYKIMFPSLLLMSVFLVYSFIKFYRNKMFLSLALLFIALSLTHLIHLNLIDLTKVVSFIHVLPMTVFMAVVILTASISCIIYGHKYLRNIVIGLCIFGALFVFGTTYRGYRTESYPQNFNLKAIQEYQQKSDKSVLWLKQVPATIFGYNVNNWNNMPYFMKQCYRINGNTVIRYYD